MLAACIGKCSSVPEVDSAEGVTLEWSAGWKEGALYVESCVRKPRLGLLHTFVMKSSLHRES